MGDEDDAVSLRRTGAGGVVAQALSSASNAIALVVAGRSLSEAELSSFAAVAFFLVIALGVLRAIAVEAIVVGVESPAERGLLLERVLRRDRMWLAAGSGSVLLGAGVWWESWALLGIGALLVYGADELARMALFGLSRVRPVIAGDATWAGWTVVILGLQVMDVIHLDSFYEAVVLWMVGALPGLVVMLVLAGGRGVPAVVPRPPMWSVRLGLVTEFGLASGVGYGAVAIAPLISSVSLGAVRGVQAIGGLVTVVISGLVTALTPRLRGSIGSERLRIATLVGLGLGVLGSVPLVAAWLTRDAVGPSLFGETWSAMRPLLLWFALYYAAVGAMAGANLLVRSSGSVGRLVFARLIAAPFTLTLALVGAAMDDAHGLAVGLALSSVVGAIAWWVVATAASRSSRERLAR